MLAKGILISYSCIRFACDHGKYVIYIVFLIFFAAGIIAFIFLRQLQADFFGDMPKWKRIFFHANMFFCMAMPFFILVYYSYATDFQRQGRYLMPMIIPLMYYVVRGYQKLLDWRGASKRVRRGVFGGSILLMVCTTLYMTYFRALPLYLESGLALDVLLNR